MTEAPRTDPVNPSPSNGPRRGRQIALATTAFVATLILLIGLTSLLQRPAAGSRPSTAPVATNEPPSAGPSGSGVGSPGPSASASPSTSASPSEPASPATVAVLVGAGDIGDCETPDDEGTAALLDGIDGTVFTAGDNAYESGSAKEFATCFNDTWGRHKDRIRPATGNHDWNTGTLDGYFGYFGAAAQGPDGDSWYSYDLGGWHVIVLDSECAEVGGCEAASPQGRWLAADLAASTATCTVAIWHKPRFSSGEHGNDRSVGPFWTALHAAGVDVVINGHDHDYERFAPQDPAGKEDRTRGIREFVAGTGGTPLRAFAKTVANSELRVSVDHGVFKLTLRATGYDWEFIPIAGDFSDRGTAACH